MKLVTIPDHQGNNTAQSIASIMTSHGITVPVPPLAAMLIFREITGGASSTRVGGSNVSSNNGIPLNTSDSLLLPSTPTGVWPYREASLYDLTEIYLLGPASDTVSIGMVVKG